MASTQAVKLTKLVEQFQLEILNKGKNYDRCQIRKDIINRPALQILDKCQPLWDTLHAQGLAPYKPQCS